MPYTLPKLAPVQPHEAPSGLGTWASPGLPALGTRYGVVGGPWRGRSLGGLKGLFVPLRVFQNPWIIDLRDARARDLFDAPAPPKPFWGAWYMGSPQGVGGAYVTRPEKDA